MRLGPSLHRPTMLLSCSPSLVGSGVLLQVRATHFVSLRLWSMVYGLWSIHHSIPDSRSNELWPALGAFWHVPGLLLRL